ncbi:MAG: SufS family cysteine desulfurase [Bacilli bacterium]|nr:SufS family cysteine desulfurase [Bacilli bacterium]MDD4282932.1 SufS family cysteine desulfurase [Bacilli bacterium]MDD4718666.1 SufS family cysteine desulfurase [Bacilli bacterium]
MNKYRNDFPMLKHDYIYFNNASTSLKPKIVIDSISDYYSNYGVNTNRGVDSLGFSATEKYEQSRTKVADFIGSNKDEIIFTRGTTESLNLVASSFGNIIISEGDEIVVSVVEHHANFIPWQELCKKLGAKLVLVPISKNGTVNPLELLKVMTNKTKIVALNHVSNVMGGINNLRELSKIVHKFNAYFVVDGAQGIIHEKINVHDLGIDFYAFSGHKMYGPMGVGILYGKKELLEKMLPIIFGGEMIDSVSIEKTTYKEAPYKFEAGTMMVPEVIGLGVAIDYIESIGYENINSYVKELRNYLVSKLEKEITDIEIYNISNTDSNLVTFNIKNIHAHDVASLLDKEKIIVRAGHHCAEPYMNELGVTATLRISLAFYNTREECDKLIEVLKKAGDYIDVLF